MSHLDGTAVDMVIVTVGPNTSLAGQKVFVDNNDPSIQYSGNWAEDKSGFDAGTLPDGFPIGNTTQQSTTPGDTMTFQFSGAFKLVSNSAYHGFTFHTGTSISMYGIFSWTNIGVISATYTLDGNTESLSFPVTSSSPEHLTADGDATNFLFYEKDNLSAGAHTLVMKITDLENHSFNLDFITYTPSFSTPAAMPVLPVGGSSSVGSTGTTVASGTAPTSGAAVSSGASTSGATSSTARTLSGSSTGTITAASGGSSASSAGSQSGGGIAQTTQTASKGAPIGAIVGGVLGGLAVLILFAILVLYMRRRRPTGNQSPTVEQRLVSSKPRYYFLCQKLLIIR